MPGYGVRLRLGPPSVRVSGTELAYGLGLVNQSSTGGSTDAWDPIAPQWLAPSSLTARPATTGTVYVCNTIQEVYDALAAIKTAQTWGNEVRLNANNVFADGGQLVLPAVSGWTEGKFNIMTTSAEASLPALPVSGVAAIGGDLSIRVNPLAHAAMMPTIRQNAINMRRICFERNTKGWYLRGLRFDMDPALASTNYGLVHIGPGAIGDSDMGPYTAATLPSELPSYIVMQQCIVHTDYPNVCYKNIRVDADYWAILNSHTYGQGRDSGDANALWMYLGHGGGLVDNTFLCHNGEVFMIGGSDITASAWLGILPSDVTFSRCRFWKDPRWFHKHPRYDSAKYGGANGVGNKNIYEMKYGERFHVKSCVMEGCYVGGQTGQAIHIKSHNQSGGMDWALTRDVYFENVFCRYVGTGIELISDQLGDGGGSGAPGQRNKVRNCFVSVDEVLNPDPASPYYQQDIYPGAKEGIRYYLYDGSVHEARPEYPVTHAFRTDHSTFMGVTDKGWRIFSARLVGAVPTPLEESYIQNSVFGSTFTGQKYDGATYSDSTRFHEAALTRHFSLADDDHFRHNVLVRRLAGDYDGWGEPTYTPTDLAAAGLNADGTLAVGSPLLAGGAMDALDGSDNGVDWTELNAAISGVIQVGDTATYADHEDLSF